MKKTSQHGVILKGAYGSGSPQWLLQVLRCDPPHEWALSPILELTWFATLANCDVIKKFSDWVYAFCIRWTALCHLCLQRSQPRIKFHNLRKRAIPNGIFLTSENFDLSSGLTLGVSHHITIKTLPYSRHGRTRFFKCKSREREIRATKRESIRYPAEYSNLKE